MGLSWSSTRAHALCIWSVTMHIIAKHLLPPQMADCFDSFTNNILIPHTTLANHINMIAQTSNLSRFLCRASLPSRESAAPSNFVKSCIQALYQGLTDIHQPDVNPSSTAPCAQPVSQSLTHCKMVCPAEEWAFCPEYGKKQYQKFYWKPKRLHQQRKLHSEQLELSIVI